MKKQISQHRSKQSARFHYQQGVELQGNGRRTVWSLLSLSIMIGMSGALAANVPQAKNYFGKVMSRQTQAAPANPTVKAESSGLTTAAKLPVQDKQLAKKISAKLATFPKSEQWSVFVQDIGSDRSAAINADATYEPASFYKLFLLAPLESKFPTDKWSTRIKGKSLKTCVDLMLRQSDNECGQAIGSLINWSYADTFNESIGQKKTRLADGKGGTTTAREVGELFISLKSGEILTDKARRQVFDSLYGQKYTTGIPSGCSGCRVANKTGDVNGYVHDGGVITHGQNSYVLIVMSKGGSFNQIADITRTVESEMYP